MIIPGKLKINQNQQLTTPKCSRSGKAEISELGTCIDYLLHLQLQDGLAQVPSMEDTH